jgi:hypothetical protein
MSQEDVQANRSRGELEMEIIAMLRNLKMAPITITRHENAGFGAEYQWQALHLHGAQHDFVTALEDALTQTTAMLYVMDDVPLPLPENIRAHMTEGNIKQYEARRARKLQERRDLGIIEE